MKDIYTEANTPIPQGKNSVYYEITLKQRRMRAGKTQKEIAAFLDITPQQYNLYELGKREIPLHLLATLSVYFGVGIEELIMIPKKTASTGKPYVERTNVILREADRELTDFEKSIFGNLTTIPCPICRASMLRFMHGAEGLLETTCPECKKSFHLIMEAGKTDI